MMRIARYVLTALLLVFIVVVYASGSTPEATIDDVYNAYAEIDAQQAEEIAGLEVAEGEETPETLLSSMTLQDDRAIQRFLGMDASMYDGILFWKSDYAMVADELVIVRAHDADAAKTIESCIEQRVSNQLGVFEGYAPEEAAKLNHYSYSTRGLYIFYAVGDRTSEWERVFDGI